MDLPRLIHFGLILGKTVVMRSISGTAFAQFLRRTAVIAAACSVVLLTLTITPAAGQTPAPEGEECAGIASTVQEIDGEVIDRAILVDEFSTNIHLFTVANDIANTQIEVDGNPELIEIGTRYRFTTISVFSGDGTTASLISSAFGDNLSCLTEEDPDDPEGDPIPVRNGIATFDDDGEAIALERPPFLPTPPISARTFFIGFGLFALLIFVGSKFAR